MKTWACLGVAFLLGCGKPLPPVPARAIFAQFDGRAALSLVGEFAEIGPKVSGSPGAAKAAEFIRLQLEKRGIEARIEEFSDASPGGQTLFRNVTGRVQGQGHGTIIFGCHYDTKGGLPGVFLGANDSGSGVGVLLELASVVSRGPRLDCDTVFAFFDGEECVKEYSERDGLWGSRHMASALGKTGAAKRVRAVVILDMVGDKDLTITIPQNGAPPLISSAFTAAREESARERFSLAGGMIDDHVPFLDAGMPAVDLIDFQYGSQPGKNDYWHTPEDQMDKLSAESLQIVGRVSLRMLNALQAPPP